MTRINLRGRSVWIRAIVSWWWGWSTLGWWPFAKWRPISLWRWLAQNLSLVFIVVSMNWELRGRAFSAELLLLLLMQIVLEDVGWWLHNYLIVCAKGLD